MVDPGENHVFSIMWQVIVRAAGLSAFQHRLDASMERGWVGGWVGISAIPVT